MFLFTQYFVTIATSLRDGFAIAWITLFLLAQYNLCSHLNKVAFVYIIEYEWPKHQTI